jgi:hypothetical protein
MNYSIAMLMNNQLIVLLIWATLWNAISFPMVFLHETKRGSIREIITAVLLGLLWPITLPVVVMVKSGLCDGAE